MKEIILATNNAHKVKELTKILKGKFDAIYTLADKGIDIDVEETGATFIENAVIKASAIADIAKMPALADDSGICVDALNGAPGVYSARYSGGHGNSADNNALLLENLKKQEQKGNTSRRAHFACAVALVYPGGKRIIAEGIAEGEITREYIGKGGFGYDPIFFSYDLGKTFGEASEEEKNAVSHRSRALAALCAKL